MKIWFAFLKVTKNTTEKFVKFAVKKNSLLKIIKINKNLYQIKIKIIKVYKKK